ncbi:MAG: RES domain-containing protein [Bauldia sp.]|nr:RES domain-containing protein [Bauldia sp.]
MRWRGVAYRGHDPNWAWQPTSGEGAKQNGGRFNPVGIPALYLALTVEGAIREASHGFARRFPPLTLCSYDCDVDDLVDLRTEAGRKAAGFALAGLACPWALDRTENRIPESWTIAISLMADGVAGILVPSFVTGATAALANLVLWRWGDALPHRVALHDPEDRLKKRIPGS